MADNYSNHKPGLTSPAVHLRVWTPTDAMNTPFVTRGLSIPAEGALRVKDSRGNIVTIPDGCLAAGIVHPLRVKKIYATGTTVVGNILIVE